MKKIWSLLMAVVVSFSLIGCSKESPKEIAEKFTNAIYQRDYAAAMSVATDESKKQLDMLAQLSREFPQTEDAKNIKIKMGREEISKDGNRATVFYTTSESSIEQRVNLVKVNDKWLVEWNKSDTRIDDATPEETTTPSTINSVDTMAVSPTEDSIPATHL